MQKLTCNESGCMYLQCTCTADKGLHQLDLLRVNTRGLACTDAWHCAAAAGPSHEHHQKLLAPTLPPKITEAKDSREPKEKGLSKLLRLITLSYFLVLATSPAHRGRAAKEIEITLSRSRAPSPACFSLSGMEAG